VTARILPRVAPAYQIGFIGISYLTFRSLDVLIAIQDRLIAALSPTTYLAYVLFFPTISAGPIDRFRRFVEDWRRSRNRAEFPHDLDGTGCGATATCGAQPGCCSPCRRCVSVS
jgi:membrane protein involved in D-alanine export